MNDLIRNCMIEGTDMTFYTTDGGQFTLSLEAWQLIAIQQVLGLYIEPHGDNYDVSMWTQDFVNKRIAKMGILVHSESV